MPQDKQAVYYLAPGTGADKAAGTRNPVRVIDDFTAPNGITGSADGKFLFVADIGAGRTWKYTINPDGSLTGKTLFCDQGSDGMTIDSEGNLYLTGNGVTIFNKDGKKIETIGIPESWTSNVCFGGADRKTLFITASRHVYRLKMRTSGTRIPGK
jgi:gluconolactonase